LIRPVIAIENARLFDEVQARTRELCGVTGAADRDLGKSCRSSAVRPAKLEPVFQKMLENATRVCGANFGQMNL